LAQAIKPLNSIMGFPVRISIATQTTLTKVFPGFSQSFLEILSCYIKKRSRPLFFMCFSV